MIQVYKSKFSEMILKEWTDSSDRTFLLVLPQKRTHRSIQSKIPPVRLSKLHHIPASENASSPRESTPSRGKAHRPAPPPPPNPPIQPLAPSSLSWSNNTIVVYQRGHWAGALADRNKLGYCQLYFRCSGWLFFSDVIHDWPVLF